MASEDVLDAAPSIPEDTDDLQYPIEETSSTPPLRLEYAMNHKRRGKAVIINNKEFDAKTGRRPRKESDVDAASLYAVFKSRGFDVKLCNNQKVADMEETFKESCKEDHSDSDCFVLAILTHSKDDDIYGKDGCISLEECILPFKLCPTLAGKPKIFIVQTSLGGTIESDASQPVLLKAAPRDTSRDQMIPQQADVLQVFSSEPVSKSGDVKGARFVQAFKHVMSKYKPDQDFINVLSETNNKIGQELMRGNEKVELPCVISTLTKKLIFHDK